MVFTATTSAHDRNISQKYKELADQIRPIVEEHLHQSTDIKDDISANLIGSIFFEDRPKTFAWSYSMQIAIAYFHLKQVNTEFDDLLTALRKCANALENLDAGRDDILRRYLSSEYDLKIDGGASGPRFRVPIGPPSSPLEKGLLQERANEDGTIDADIIAKLLLNRKRLSERETSLLVDKLTGTNGLDRLRRDLSVLAHFTGMIKKKGLLAPKETTRHKKLPIAVISSCSNVWASEYQRLHPDEWIKSIQNQPTPRNTARPPQTLSPEAPGPMGRFAQDVFEKLRIPGKGGSIANAAAAFKALKNYSEARRDAGGSKTFLYRKWSTDSDIS